MILLALDIGSSSVKSALVRERKIVGQLVRVSYRTRMDGAWVEIEAWEILRAVGNAIEKLGKRAKSVDALAISSMGPAWLAMDGKHDAITPIVTHQDRRSIEQAREIEERVGKAKHLRVAGNRPFPGGISSTTCAWYLQNNRSLMRRAGTVGHLSTFLVAQLTGARVIDPSQASFTGLYETVKLGGWSELLCDAVGVRKSLLPEVREGNEIAGTVTARASRRFGLRQGLPVCVGVIDGSAGMLVTNAEAGQLFNVTGSTDVLALCTEKARPHEELLTRALGVGRKWMSVATIAAAGSAIAWMKDQCFADHDWPAYQKVIRKISLDTQTRGVEFEPYLAGSRTSIEQRAGAFKNLTLATTRENMLAAVLESLATQSAQRLRLLATTRARMRKKVVCSGGAQEGVERILYRDWGKRWRFKREENASLRGLWSLVDR